MLGRFGPFVLGFVLGGLTVYASLHFHVVRAESGVHFIPKLQSTFAQTYVDIRGYDIDDWNRNRLLAAAITHAGKSDLFRDNAIQPVHRAVDQFFDALQNVQ